MKTNVETPEDRLEKYEEQLESLHSYLKELKAMTAKHGTESAQFEEDLMEIEHNIEYYENEMTEMKGTIKKPGKPTPPQTGAAPPQAGIDAMLPHTAKQGIGSLILSSISFVAGAFLGSKLKSRRADKDASEEKKRS